MANLLRDYQQELYNKTVEALKQGYRRPLIVAPCGAGKSYLFAEMIKNAKGEALVLTHRQELKAQHEQLFKKLGITNVRVSMILTEANRLGKYPTPTLIVADEAHLSRSNSWAKVIKFYDTYTVGFTATPIRLDGKPLGDIFDVLIEGVDTKWLIENHRLAPYEYYAPMTVDTTGLEHICGDFAVTALDRLMNERAIYGNVLDCYRKFANGERTICFCVSVRHAKQTAEMFCAAGIKADYLCSKTPESTRQTVMDNFKNGKITVLCNVGIISEGVSIDEISCCMLLRPTESVALGVQQMMRCMRYLPNKKAKILDLVGNYTRIGLPDDEREWSLTKPMERKKEFDKNGDFYIRCCPECFMTFKTAPTCPFCGATYPLHIKEIRAHSDIELAKITVDEIARIQEKKRIDRIEQGRAQTFDELVALGRRRGYKNPTFWAAKVMRGRRK